MAHAQPVKQWQDRNGEWHFGDPRAAPTRGSSDVTIQRPINVIRNDQPLPQYTPDSSSARANTAQRRRAAQPQNQSQKRRSKTDCASLRESLKLSFARQQQQQQRQQQYERECVIGVYYADSQQ